MQNADLVILGDDGANRHGKKLWRLRCVCGAEFSAVASQIKSKKTTSCGCRRKQGNPKHGLRGHSLYATWCNMKARCDNPNHPQFKDYGGRGVVYAPNWSDFSSFLSSVGEKPFPEASLDRIDNNGNYEPDNVRWADRRTQRVNSRQITEVTIGGVTKLVTDWCKEYGIALASVHRRMKRGMTVVEALTMPKATRFL